MDVPGRNRRIVTIVPDPHKFLIVLESNCVFCLEKEGEEHKDKSLRRLLHIDGTILQRSALHVFPSNNGPNSA